MRLSGIGSDFTALQGENLTFWIEMPDTRGIFQKNSVILMTIDLILIAFPYLHAKCHAFPLIYLLTYYYAIIIPSYYLIITVILNKLKSMRSLYLW